MKLVSKTFKQAAEDLKQLGVEPKNTILGKFKELF